MPAPATLPTVEDHPLGMAEAGEVTPLPIPAPKPTIRLHVGIKPNGPAWNHNIYGVSFPQTTSIYDDTGTEHRKLGTVVELDRDALRKVRDGIRSRVVRWNKVRDKEGRERKISAEIWDSTTFGFRFQAGDEPLEPYLFLEVLKEEFVLPQASGTVLAAIDKALESAEKSEQIKLQDPKDAQIRADHGRRKATGQRLGDEAST